jgi:activator of HSP90 ATPase
MQPSSPNAAMSRRRWVQSAAAGSVAFPASAFASPSSPDGEVRTSEVIHYEHVFHAGPKRIYEALTDSAQFHKLELLGAAAKVMDIAAHPAMIGREPGSAFSLFTGHILGRQLELVPSRRIVQAWRVATWDPGAYSIASFMLEDQGGATKVIFDHTGFPAGLGQHLNEGWHGNYWEPLEKFLAA